MMHAMAIRSHRAALALSILTLAFCAGLQVGAAAPGGKRSKEAGPDAVGNTPTMTGKGNGPRARAEVPTTTGVMYGPRRLGHAVYPAQQIPLRFNHGQHLALGMDCTACHSNIATSRRSADNNFPRGVSCDACHGQQHPRPRTEPAKCDLCHTAVDEQNRVTAGLRAPAPMLHFNHELHARVGASCESCHGDMSKVRLATTAQLPTEQSCLDCHDGFGATQRCGACHPTQADGRLALRAIDDRTMPALVPRGESWGIGHDLAFVEDHAAVTKANPGMCESCHDETFCLDCHAGAVRPMRIHAGDYITVHALDARARTQDCQACHRTQTFCLGCHERMGFGERLEGDFGIGGSLTFHPPGWSGPPGLPQDHAQAAQRNMAACASCHTEDSCLACHATTGAATPGLGVNPHGPGFRDSPRCQALAVRNRRACLKCHPPGVPALECL